MKKVVIASDSFKGSVSSMVVAKSAETAVLRVFPSCEVLKIPVADGGEGSIDALVSAMKGGVRSCEVHGPLMEIVQAEYGILGDGKTAVIEMAKASGLPLVPESERNPMLTTTYGTGELIKDAILHGCKDFIVCIGGSATNDAGTGMLQALGFRFLDKAGSELGQGGQILEQIYSIDKSNVLPQLQEVRFTVACDVNNPFSGENGAAFVYARQKGADDAMIYALDRGLKSFADVISRTESIDIDPLPGAGAAGGLGGGFMAFLNATLKPGIQTILEALRFEKQIENADLIITGEGKLDAQTGMGKAPEGILKIASKQDIPVVAIGGCIESCEALNKQGFLAVLPLLPCPVTLKKAMDKKFTCQNIERTIHQLMRLINYFSVDNIKE